MDFMKLLKSIEELLYELITWFVFYPLTLWRIIRHPLTMLAYAQNELTEKDHDPFDDAVSPPILLLLTLVLLHLLESAVNAAWASVLPALFQDDRNLLIFRALVFSLFPLLYATAGLRSRGARLTRNTLKPAFYSQSYATVPFVLSLSIGLQAISIVGQTLNLIGWSVMVLGLGWYLAVQTVWLAKANAVSMWRAFALVIGLFFGAVALMILVLVIVSFFAQAVPAAT